MGNPIGNIYFFFIAITITASKSLSIEEVSQDELRQIEQELQRLAGPKVSLDHGRPNNLGMNAHEGPLDSTSIQTLNLIFKHNNIGAREYNHQDPHNADDKAILNLHHNLGLQGVVDHSNSLSIARCGCPKQPAKRSCECLGRDGNGPEEDEVSEKTLPVAAKHAVHSSAKIDKLENVLDNIEEALQSSINEYPVGNHGLFKCQGTCEIVPSNEEDDSDEDDNRNGSQGEDNLKDFLDELEKSLLQSNKELKCKGLRCGCNGIGRCGCNRVPCDCDSDYCELEEDENDRATDESTKLTQKKDLSAVANLPKPKIYKINDDLDAYVFDASNTNDLFQLLRNNLQSSQRTRLPKSNRRKEPKQSRSYIRPVKTFRRSSDPNSYGLPFELELDGLGQVNP